MTTTPIVHVKNGEVFANSRDVAEFFGKRHCDVLRDLDKLLSATDADLRWFFAATYVDAKGELRPCFDMTKDGFTLLVMGYTGSKAMQVSKSLRSPLDPFGVHGASSAPWSSPKGDRNERYRPLDALAQRINEEQHQIEHHAKGMLVAAKLAGEALIEAKKMLPHGQFKQWVETNTKVSYRQARKYMQVAKLASQGHFDTSLGINAFLDQYAEEKPKAPASNLPAFTEDDAEYALKIAARMDSEFEGEREVAKAKLEKMAKDHGMTSGELLEKARAIQPLNHLAEAEKELNALREELARRDRILSDLKRRFAGASKDELIEILADLKARGMWKG